MCVVTNLDPYWDSIKEPMIYFNSNLFLNLIMVVER